MQIVKRVAFAGAAAFAIGAIVWQVPVEANPPAAIATLNPTAAGLPKPPMPVPHPTADPTNFDLTIYVAVDELPADRWPMQVPLQIECLVFGPDQPGVVIEGYARIAMQPPVSGKYTFVQPVNISLSSPGNVDTSPSLSYECYLYQAPARVKPWEGPNANESVKGTFSAATTTRIFAKQRIVLTHSS